MQAYSRAIAKDTNYMQIEDSVDKLVNKKSIQRQDEDPETVLSLRHTLGHNTPFHLRK